MADTRLKSHIPNGDIPIMQSRLTLLMSAKAIDAFGTRIAATLADVPHHLTTPDNVLSGREPGGADIAFLSRDVTADSGKVRLAPSLMQYYDAMRASPNLRWFQAHSAGADRPIFAEMLGRGVTVTTASGANAIPVAQMAFLGALALARNLPALIESQRHRRWEPFLGDRAPRDIAGQTAVVVGLGPIGREVARLLKAVNVHVIGVNRSGNAVQAVDETIALHELERVLPGVSIVVLACPLTDATRGLMNRRTLALLPRGATLVNVSRGEIANQSDLIDALASGHLAGAFLDVFEQEPLDTESPLWTLPNVFVSPHTAGHTAGHYAEVGKIFLDNLGRWKAGAPLRNVIATA